MLCAKCLINVVKYLSNLHGIDGFEISLESKKIKVIYFSMNQILPFDF
jgi:copper chaperone